MKYDIYEISLFCRKKITLSHRCTYLCYNYLSEKLRYYFFFLILKNQIPHAIPYIVRSYVW